MIHLPTVFVLGAGASMPYGFPSGAELRSKICNHEIDGVLRGEYGPQTTREFTTAFKDSHLSSIDAFLSRRPEHIEIGKLAIAATICSKENPTSFDSPNDDDWYSLLWNKLVSDVHTPDDLARNDIKIVTFNYDRSLEYFLLTSIINTFGVAYEKANEALKHIPIVHFYGQLGKLGYGVDYHNGVRQYHPYENPEELHLAAKGIKIMPESREDDGVISTARDWFKRAHNICFLGFGFDRLNISRLGLDKALEEMYGKEALHLSVMASCYRVTTSEAELAGKALVGGLMRDCWKTHEGTNTATLREYAFRFR